MTAEFIAPGAGGSEFEADGPMFTADELTMIHRAVRQKISRNRNDIARERRKPEKMHFARGKARAQYDYAGLLLKLDTMVPEDER